MGATFLLIAVPLLLFYLWLASRTTRWLRKLYPQKKWPARLLIAFWVLLPTWDSILVTFSRAEFDATCIKGVFA